MKRLWLIIGCYLLLTSNLSAQSLGLKLATISDGKYHTESEALVKRYNNILSKLDTKYIETETQIGDMTSVAKKQLDNIGVSEPLINIMEGINRLVDKKTKTKKYSENITCYIIYRSNGYSHAGSLKKLQDQLAIMSMDSIRKSLGF